MTAKKGFSEESNQRGRPKKVASNQDERLAHESIGEDNNNGEGEAAEEPKSPSWLKQFKALYKFSYGTGHTTIYRKWVQSYLPSIPVPLRYDFLLLNPDLRKWQPVFSSKTPADCLKFVFAFIDNFGLFMDPSVIAGRPLRVVVFLYYLNFSHEYLVFDKSQEVYYQFNGTHWLMVTQGGIIRNAMAFISRFQVADCVKALTHDQTALFEEIKPHISVVKWPFRSGRGCRNGFFHLYNNYYSLSEHSPGQWQRSVRDIEVPEGIVPLPSKFGARFKLDSGEESVKAMNLLKLLFYYSFEPSGNQVLFNVTGNPRGSKSMLLKVIKWAFRQFAKEGNINHLNPFQLLELLLNTKVVLFPDSNPLSLNRSTIDTLKRITGGDTVNAEAKYEKGLRIAGEYTLILVNNVNFEDVPAFKEAGMSDRVLNIILPSIKSQAALPTKRFEKLLEKEVPYLFLSSLSISKEFLYSTTRSRDVNAAMGTGLDNPLIEYIQRKLIASKGDTVGGGLLYSDYHKFLAEILPDKSAIAKHKFGTKQGFYQQLGYQFTRMDTVEITQGRDKRGTVFKNVMFGDPEKFPGQEFNFSSSYVNEYLLENPLVVKSLTFRGDNGDFENGPRINPEYNVELLKIFNQVKSETIKTIVDGGVNDLPSGQHLEKTGFGGSHSTNELKDEDFIEQEEVIFQPKLYYRGHVEDGFPYADELEIGELTPLLFGDNTHFYFVRDDQQKRRNFRFRPKKIKDGGKFFSTPVLRDTVDMIDKYNSLNRKVQSNQPPPPFEIYTPKALKENSDKTIPGPGSISDQMNTDPDYPENSDQTTPGPGSNRDQPKPGPASNSDQTNSSPDPIFDDLDFSFESKIN